MLAARYGLDRAAAARIRHDAESEPKASAQDTVQFTRLIKDAVPYEERIGVVEALWRIAATDGINADEQGFMRLTASLLGVSDQDSGLARQRVLEARAEGPLFHRARRRPLDRPPRIRSTDATDAGVAQLVEHQLPKLRVAGSNPVARSNRKGAVPAARPPEEAPR